MKRCELCPGVARTYCESDQASLCFDCDSRVHAANFLVARHSRVLLCRTCQSPTPWKASGPKLGPAVSFCDTCLAAGRVMPSRKKTELEVGDDDEGESKEREITEQERENDDVDVDDEDDDVSDDDEEEEEEEEEEGEEQVVPLTVEEAATPPEASSSSSDDDSTTTMARLKRTRSNGVDPTFYSTFFERNSKRSGLLNPVRVADDDEATSESFRPAKDRRNSLDSGSRRGGLDLMPFRSSHPPNPNLNGDLVFRLSCDKPV